LKRPATIPERALARKFVTGRHRDVFRATAERLFGIK
jgi:hypothetical protein